MTGWQDDFLEDLEPKTWKSPEGTPAINPSLLFLGQGASALEVALATSLARPKADDVRRLWTRRKGNRASPVLLVVGYPEQGQQRLTVCGPAGEHPALMHGLTISQVERLVAAALAEPNRHSAVRFLVGMLPETDSDLPGLRNSGLLATQELQHGVPGRPDWAMSNSSGRKLLGLSGRQLLEGLGFSVVSLSTNSSVLTVGDGPKRAVAVFLEKTETFDDAATRFEGTSPVSQAMAQADREGLPWVVLTRGRQIRLYAARPDTGVGRKGRAETYVEINLALLPDDMAGYLPLLFGSGALTDGGTIEDILEQSADFAAGLATRLRERVFFDAVPNLATAVAARLGETANLTDEDLAHSYEQTLIILFRLLFVAYAEDKDLLPYRSNSKYADHSLKHITRRLAEDRRAGTEEFDDDACDLWEDVRQLWRAVDRGNRGWGVPGYNGGLFSDDPDVSSAGAALASIELTDAEFGPALAAMLVDVGTDGVIGPVDFRSLSVREFGTIYEGLLESMLSIAQVDLTVDAKGSYVPTKKKSDEVFVEAGEIYFHDRSGSRKATGSYFTKHFAVEHLLDHSLEPALDDHLTRVSKHLDVGDEAAATEAFFDFRCVDIAMGSGHFLVAAVDRIEARFSNFLALNPIPAINAELDTLRKAALDALGDLADGFELETTSLLRRQIARRCVYGADLNHISVELARLAIWIHTFVPGLPLSFLDHSLVHGNSLTGIGTLDEALSVLDPNPAHGTVSLFRGEIEEFLGRASDALRRLATITETTAADIKEARIAQSEAHSAIQPARQLFDLLVAVRLSQATCPVSIDEATIAKNPGLARGEELAAKLQALHFPIAFPEVFLRERPGFDCILGNPPWEEVKFEQRDFLTVRNPGLRSLSQADYRRFVANIEKSRPDLVRECEAASARVAALKTALVAGPFPGITTGDADLYQAFCWRFWQLVRADGAIGVVLPRSALSAAGSAPWRLEVLDHGAFSDVTMLLNTAGWVFDDAEHRYTIGLVTIRKGDHWAGEVALSGPFPNLEAYKTGRTQESVSFAAEDFKEWSEGASFPLLPSAKAASVFRTIREHPRLDSDEGEWKCRPTTEFHATADKGYFDLEPADTEGLWPVYKGASFNLWEPDTGTYYAWADPGVVVPVLQAKRKNSAAKANSPFGGIPQGVINDSAALPCWSPRIAFRGITNRTNKRTVIASLIYPQVVIQNSAPYLLWAPGDERDQAYLLGVLCSIPLDWYARTVVEINVNFHLFNAFPIPRPKRDDPHRLIVEQIAGRLAAVDDWFADWAAAVGVEVGSVADDERDNLIYQLDAAVAHLYGFSEEDLRVIFGTFHAGWDFEPRLAAVLDHFQDLK